MIDEYDILELRLIQILDSKVKWWTIEEFANQLQVSKTTIQKYLKSIKIRIRDLDYKGLSIETSTSKGIYFHRPAAFNVQFLYTQILKEHLTLSILNSFLYSDHLTSIKLASDNFVSVASIRRKYKSINIYFENLRIAIKKDRLVGDERQIRWFYSELYWQVYRGVEWPFAFIPRDFVDGMIDTIEEFFKVDIVPEVREEMVYWIAINGLRHIKGYRVSEDEEIHNYAINNPLFPRFIEILRYIFPNEAKNNDPKGRGEMQYLFLLLSALPVLEKHEDYSRLIFEAHEKGNTLMYKMSQEWLELYEKFFGKICDETLRHIILNKLLRIHSYSYLYTMGESLVRNESYLSEVITYHPRFFKKMDAILRALAKKYPDITENREYLMENYTLLAIENLSINQFEHEIQIALSFSKGILYESVIQEKLLARFTGKYRLNFVHYSEPKEILITDLPYILENESFDLVSAETKLTERDYYNIEETILKYI